MDYLGVVLLVAALATAFVVIARSSAWQGRRARAEQQSQLALAKRAAEADVVGLTEALTRLSVVAETDPQAQEDYDSAAAAHARAVRCLAEASEPDDGEGETTPDRAPDPVSPKGHPPAKPKAPPSPTIPPEFVLEPTGLTIRGDLCR